MLSGATRVIWGETECSRSARPLAQAEKWVSERVMKLVKGMVFLRHTCYRGPSGVLRSARPLAQAEKWVSERVMKFQKNPLFPEKVGTPQIVYCSSAPMTHGSGKGIGKSGE